MGFKKENTSSVIPVGAPLLTGNEVSYVNDCMETGFISSVGNYNEQFERSWATYCGRKHGIAVSSGTAALQVAVDALRLAPGDEVIIPSFTIIACVIPVIRAGATPILVDCDPETFCMDLSQVAAAITQRTRAIMVVHMYGHPVDMDGVWELANKHNLFVIEDAAQGHGCEYLSRRDGNNSWLRCGGMGTVSTFSFYANKIITTGEGGMVLTDDENIAERARGLRNLCFGFGQKRFDHEDLGYNFRLSNVLAAIGFAQVERIEEILSCKRRIGARYDELFADVLGVHVQVKRNWARVNYWMYGLVVDDDVPIDNAELAKRLKKRGIDTRPFFKGMHEQTAFHQRGLFCHLKFPVTERLSRRGLYLPSGVSLTDEQIRTVATAVRESLHESAFPG
jgi:perosamine synthetase